MRRLRCNKPLIPCALMGVTVFAALSLYGCAKQGYPSGGPRDEQVPVAQRCKPENESLNFAEKQFFIEFDEYVVLKDAANNVLVSPPMANKPDFTTKGKGVLVKINDTLQANTTYLFQFKDAIADFTEGNLLPSFEYVFSTGNQMDKKMLGGKVEDARSGKPWAETVSVLAYRDERFTADSTDTIATNGHPDFVTRCDKNGFYSFHYIPEGRYRLVALADKNRNLHVDVAEAAAWNVAAVHTVDSIDSNSLVEMRISAPDTRKQRLLKGEFTRQGHITISTLLPMQKPSLEGGDIEWRLNSKRDTIDVWLKNLEQDSIMLVLRDTNLNDTLRLRFRSTKARGKSKAKPTGLVSNTDDRLMRPLCEGTKAFYDDLRIAFKNPVVNGIDNPEAIIMRLEDSSIARYPVTLDSGGLFATIDATLRSGEKYSVTLQDSLFRDLYGEYTDSISFNAVPKDYSTLRLLVANKTSQPLIIELLDSRDTVVARKQVKQNNETLVFKHIGNGDHRLRAVIDSDGNGVWTPGDYRKQRQPEEQILYDKTLQMREKWELEERWTVERPFTLLLSTPKADTDQIIGITPMRP